MSDKRNHTSVLNKAFVVSLRSHGNDIVQFSFRSEFWNERVDCSHGSGNMLVLGPVHAGMALYHSEAFRAKNKQKKI